MMFILTIRLKNTEAPIVMHYETSEGAEASRAHVGAMMRYDGGGAEVLPNQKDHVLTDGFGHSVTLCGVDISAVFVSDVARDCEARVRCQMIAQRAQADFQAKMANDPAIKLRQSIMGGRG